MTDLEMTKLCAEAMEIDFAEYFEPDARGHRWISCGRLSTSPYDPLNDDAQAMALVRKIELNILKIGGRWTVAEAPRVGCAQVDNENINRAIVECVAKMRAAK